LDKLAKVRQGGIGIARLVERAATLVERLVVRWFYFQRFAVVGNRSV